MIRKHRLPQSGVAAIEFLLCLPLLLLLAFPVVDLARILQANIILTNISREGANLVVRTQDAKQEIMESLASTALPLNMRKHGAIHITQILAHSSKGAIRNVVMAQYRWVNGRDVAVNGVWTCGAGGSHWDAKGTCAGLPKNAAVAPEVNIMRGQLRDGDVVYLVEVFYKFPPLFAGMDLGALVLPNFGSNLYAFTIL